MRQRKVLGIVRRVFCREFGIDRSQVKYRVQSHSVFGPRVGMDMSDGLDLATLAFALEDAFEMRIPGSVPLRWKTIRQVVQYVVRRLP